MYMAETRVLNGVAGNVGLYIYNKITASALLYGTPLPNSWQYFNAQGKEVSAGEIAKVVGADCMSAIYDLGSQSKSKYTTFMYKKSTDCKGSASEVFSPPELQQRDVKAGVDKYLIAPAMKKLSTAPNIWVSQIKDWPDKTLKISICSKQ